MGGAGADCLQEAPMENVDRRVALTLGLAAAQGLVFDASAAVAPYHPDFGKDIAPGVRQVDLGAVASTLPGYKTVTMRDLVFQPSANTFDPMTQNDMIGYVTDGLIRVRLDDREWVAKKDAPWISPRGIKTAYRNTGADIAVLRIIDLVNV